uniref:Phosphodiesterase n=1 Tax=Guillardia theta TaxID=55529 RepID=A0A7S4KJ92_GUITH|mmetsp:Transcript_25336/g.83807  ORF Transcript_25336/g.83807 Transcript_25336/m.83807 type:complete len:697 (+) Transcript_25336:446-2536(+)
MPSLETETLILEDCHLKALDAVPLCVTITDYSEPPKNIWANASYLSTVGVSFDAFVSQDVLSRLDAEEKERWKARYQKVQVERQMLIEKDIVPAGKENISVEAIYGPASVKRIAKDGQAGETIECVMTVRWPLDIRRQLEENTKYMTSLLECSPYPLCFFTFDGHLITCNPAAVGVFGKTIWLQSDIFGMSERERRGLNDQVPAISSSGSFSIERTERRTAYENMMEALSEEGSSYEVDLPIKRENEDGTSELWYCRIFAQRQKDPFTGEPIIMISHQDVTNLRKVECELGRLEMSEHTRQHIVKQHDSDVAGSLMVLLGEDWNFLYDGGTMSDARSDGEGDGDGTPRSLESTVSANSAGLSSKPMQLQGLRACLERADDWDFNVFDLEREADGLPLQVLCWHVFMKHNLIEEFHLDQVKFVNFLRTIESGHSDNPYHNATHVADVVQSMHCLLVKGGVGKFVGKLEILAGLLASCIHDFEHRGFNNDFLVKTQDDWAIDSNDKSPNESHHLSSSFRILRQPECNFLHQMPQAQQAHLRKLVIDMVMATDMGEHMAIVSKLKSDLQKRLENPDDDIGSDPPDALKTLILQGAIKVADIGHLYADHEVHIQWSERLEEEMWRQGDVEKQREMKISFLMDREKPGVTKSQPGFVDFVVRPLFDTWCACFPESKVLLERIDRNYEYWKSKEKEHHDNKA